MQTTELIYKKRQGKAHTRAELQFLVDGLLSGEVKDYQFSAWLMAVCFQELSSEEKRDLTEIMWKSGVSLPRTDKGSYFWIDKHSTGGVGDKTSLILVPLLIAVSKTLRLPLKIPMISGRGLGHTGGTLDKLAAVSGFSSNIQIPKALELLEKNGFFMMGQTKDVAPADRLIYALRDATSTVESVSLITASIMSKKLSESLDGLVLDLKWGSGAFMKTSDQATVLGKSLMEVARSVGVSCVGVLTNMNEPLGWKVGNSLEVEECFDFILNKGREPGLLEVVVELGAAMIFLGSMEKVSIEEGRVICAKVLNETQVLSKYFKQMFEAQGGDFKRWHEQGGKRKSKLCTFEFRAKAAGWLAKVEPRTIGMLVSQLGGGRMRAEDDIDPEVGIEFFKKVGDSVSNEELIARVYYRDSSQLGLIKQMLSSAISFSNVRIEKTKWIQGVLV